MPETIKNISKKDAILKAALQLFSHRSFGGTTIPEIARVANVGAGTIYRYFISKEDLVNELFVRVLDDFTEHLQVGLHGQMDTRTRFHHLFNNAWNYVMNNVEAFLFINLNDEATYLNDRSRKSFSRMWDYIAEMVEQGADKGELIKLDPKFVASLVYGPLIPISKRFNNDNRQASQALAKALEEATWRAISTD